MSQEIKNPDVPAPTPLSMDAFFTKPEAEKGVKVPLFRPDGSDTNEFLMIRGCDSDEFRIAEAISNRRVIRNGKDNKNEREVAEEILSETRECVAALIISWSLKEPCTHENKIKFLKGAPQVADSINRVATNRALFFGESSKAYRNTQE